VHAAYAGEIEIIGVVFEHPGFSYGKYAVAPGEPVDGELYLANFEWVANNLVLAEVPFPFVQADDYDGAYTLRACIFGPQPQLEVIACTEIAVFMPNCEPDEVSLGQDCIPAAVDVTPAPSFVPDELVAIPSRNANCREGASATFFDIDDTLFQDSEYLPTAQGSDGLWLLFEGPVSGNRCWALSDNIDLFCNDQPVQLAALSPCSLGIAQYPPLPTLTSTPPFTPEAPVTAVPLPQCSDGIDNDGDGNIDMADGRCLSPTDDDENR
jgi:hypothetical protein